MPNTILSSVDDIDSRRELHRLFELLDSPQRIAFLIHVCTALGPVGCTLKGANVSLVVTNDTMTPTEAYGDVLLICTQFGIDPQQVARELERYVRHVTKPGKILLPSELA